MLEQLNRINVLCDIYSPLLTGRQQEVLKLYFFDNYSLGEIAADSGVSRQAVYDLIQRALVAIERFEEKLGLYRRFNHQQDLLAEAEAILSESALSAEAGERLKEIISELRSSNEQ